MPYTNNFDHLLSTPTIENAQKIYDRRIATARSLLEIKELKAEDIRGIAEFIGHDIGAAKSDIPRIVKDITQ